MSYAATALFDFGSGLEDTSDIHYLRFCCGDRLQVINPQESEDWWWGDTGADQGFFAANCPWEKTKKTKKTKKQPHAKRAHTQRRTAAHSVLRATHMQLRSSSLAHLSSFFLCCLCVRRANRRVRESPFHPLMEQQAFLVPSLFCPPRSPSPALVPSSCRLFLTLSAYTLPYSLPPARRPASPRPPTRTTHNR